jgi:pSer/pThr/pTyr-binding forkhead associated (FHA) protein
MSSTPRETPIVPPPRAPATGAEPKRRSQLKAPIVVAAIGKEWELESGSLTIGRDSEATVVIEDPLISRLHARLIVRADGLVIVEDLHSSNGVFINGCKASRPLMPLHEGDRLLVGTTEIGVFSLRPSATVCFERSTEKPSLPIDATMPSPALPNVSSEDKGAGRRRATATTRRGDTTEMVALFAEQLMESGHPLEAVRALSEHLQNLLKGASAGLTVPDRILDCATRNALRLHDWTQRSNWVDYVFELHVACQQLPSDASLQALEPVCRKTSELDRNLISYLIKAIEGKFDNPTANEKQRLLRLQQLAR